jgi:hypothetical protein
MTPEQNESEKLLNSYPHGAIQPFLRRYGRLFTPQPLPRVYRMGQWRACFENSYRMAIRHPVIYVEGIAKNSRSPIPHLHAWCVDASGGVLDRTWNDATAYFGVPLRTDFIKQVIRERQEEFFGFLDDWEHGFPLAKTLLDMPELWLADLGSSE